MDESLLYEVGRNMIFANGQYRWVGYTHAELKQLCGGNYKPPKGATIRSVIRESFTIASELAHTLNLTYKQVG